MDIVTKMKAVLKFIKRLLSLLYLNSPKVTTSLQDNPNNVLTQQYLLLYCNFDSVAFVRINSRKVKKSMYYIIDPKYFNQQELVIEVRNLLLRKKTVRIKINNFSTVSFNEINPLNSNIVSIKLKKVQPKKVNSNMINLKNSIDVQSRELNNRKSKVQLKKKQLCITNQNITNGTIKL